MGSYKLVWFKEVATGKTFATSGAGPELLNRILKSEVVIEKIESIKTPEFLSSIEVTLLQLHHKEDVKLPEELEPYLKEALRKQKELIEYSQSLEERRHE